MDDLVWSGVQNVLSNLIEESIEVFLGLLISFSSIINTILNSSEVKDVILLSQGIAGSILVVKVAFEALNMYIFRINGEPIQSPGDFLIGIAKAAAVIGSIPWLVKWIFQFGTLLALDVQSITGDSDTNDFANAVSAIDHSHFFLLALVVFSTVLFFIVFFQTFVRAGELAIAAVIGSIMALGLTNPDSLSFQHWLKEVIRISITQAIQLLAVRIAFLSFKWPLGDGLESPMNHIIMFVAFLWVAVKAPTIIKQYVSSTGFGRTDGTSYAMRKMFSKGA